MRGVWLRCVVASVVVLVGCASSNAVRCGDLTCPVGSTCGPNNECIPQLCGNDALDGSEQCDGSATIMASNLRCTDFGYYGVQSVACTATCEIDTSVCNGTCGDHIANGPELCDGIPPEGYACADFGFDVGGLDCSDACSVTLDSCTALGWRDAAGGGTDELRAVWLDDTGNGVAVGLRGTVLRADQGVWSPLAPVTAADLYGVYGFRDASDPNNVHTVVIAVGADGTILRYENGALMPVTSPTGVDLFAIAGTSLDRAYIVGAGGTILKLSGTGWTAVTSPTPNALYGIAVNELGALAVGASGTILREVNGTWSLAPGAPSTTSALRAVAAAGTDLFVGGDNATLFHFVAAGSGGAWSTIDIAPLVPNTVNVLSLYAARRTTTAVDAFVGLSGGYLVRWDGTEAVLQTSPTTRSIFGMAGVSASRVVAVTRGGRVIQYSGTDRSVVAYGVPPQLQGGLFRRGNLLYTTMADGWFARAIGGVWNAFQITSLVGSHITSVWASPSTVVLGVGAPSADPAQRGVWTSPVPATATSFTKVTALGDVGINGVTGAGSTVYAVGAVIARSNGTTWTTDLTLPAGQVLDAVFVTADGDAFAVGGDANGGEHALVYHRGGADTTWTKMTIDVPRELRAVWGTSATNVFAVGAVGTIVHFDGTTWRPMYTGTAEDFSTIHGSSASDVYAAGANSNLYHYDGLAWSRMTELGANPFGVWAERDEVVVVSQQSPSSVAETITRPLVEREDRCQDPFDNDGDGLLNCADDDCRDSFACLRGGACETTERITCETAGLALSTFTGRARIDDFACLDHSTPGPEAAMRFVAETTGPVTITIDDPSSALDLVVLDSKNFGCDVTTCRPPVHTGTAQSVTFDAVAGQVYFAVVDGPVSTALPFTVSVSCD